MRAARVISWDMMNFVWGGMLIVALVAGICTGQGDVVADAMLFGAQEAVTLCISLGGAYMLWMGLLNVAKEAGLMDGLARLLRPAFSRLFPGSPQAVGPVTLNLAANFFGMGSAATPFGLEAMAAMQRTNPQAEVATDDMCLFLCLNASAPELLPTAVLALRTVWGSADAAAVVVPTFLASLLCAGSAVAGCVLCKRAKRP